MCNCVGISPYFKHFSQNSHGFINIHEYYNMFILKFYHLLNNILFGKFGTQGHLAKEILFDL